MFRIDNATAVAVLPAPAAAGAPGYFKKQAPGSGLASTIVTDDWANGVQEELMSILDAAGIDPDKTQYDQVLQAILSIMGAQAVVGAGAIHGMELSPAVGHETTRITVSAGLCRDSTNAAGGVSPAAFTKDLTAVWAAGDSAGGRLSGALANGQTWHVFALINPLTNAVEFGFDTSPSAPDLVTHGVSAAGYTKFRRLGSIVLDAAATTIRPFIQDGDYFEYTTRSTDYAAQSNGGGVAYLRSVACPVGIRTKVYFYFQSTGTANATAYLSGIFDPDKGVPPAFGGASQRAAVRRVAAYQAASGADLSYGTVDRYWCHSDTTGKIYTFSSDNAGDVIALGVIGWEDNRGRFF